MKGREKIENISNKPQEGLMKNEIRTEPIDEDGVLWDDFATVVVTTLMS